MKNLILLAVFAIAFATVGSSRTYYVSEYFDFTNGNTGVIKKDYDMDINKTCRIFIESETYYQGVIVETQVEYSGGTHHDGRRDYLYAWEEDEYTDYARTSYIETLNWVLVEARNWQNVPTTGWVGYSYVEIRN